MVEPDKALLAAIAETSPENPFRTVAFARARALGGAMPVAFLAGGEGRGTGCTAFIVERRLRRDLEIVSAPGVAPEHCLWTAIAEFCAGHGIDELRVQSFGSSPGGIPVFGSEIMRRRRKEYVLRFGGNVTGLSLSSNHRRNFRRASNAGITVVETMNKVDCETHASLIDLSMSRRFVRGESVSVGTSSEKFRYLVEAGAGVLFQARAPGGEVMSSIMVLLAKEGAYYHSAGTSPEGMLDGASQFLITTVSERLESRGVRLFNLGGAADDQPGLARFKSGFGAESIELEAANFRLASGLRGGFLAVARVVSTGLERWRNILSA